MWLYLCKEASTCVSIDGNKTLWDVTGCRMAITVIIIILMGQSWPSDGRQLTKLLVDGNLFVYKVLKYVVPSSCLGLLVAVLSTIKCSHCIDYYSLLVLIG